MTFHNPRRSAFTLVELLVVIGIIGLLIGILLPALATARESGRRTVCLANLRSIGQCMFMYAENHRDILPNQNAANEWVNYNAMLRVLRNFADGYVKSPKTFWCPSDRDPAPTAITTAEYDMSNSVHTSYEYYSIWWPGRLGPKLVKLHGQAPLAWDLDGGQLPPGSTNKPSFNKNHGKKGGCVVYADGRAEWQEARLWDDESWPSPAAKYYPNTTD